jgi:hypothetical protein
VIDPLVGGDISQAGTAIVLKNGVDEKSITRGG